MGKDNTAQVTDTCTRHIAFVVCLHRAFVLYETRFQDTNISLLQYARKHF